MRSQKLIITFTCCAIMSGCASIVSSSQYPVKIDSSVSGATVTIKDKNGTEVQKVTTPALVTLSSGGGWESASYMFEFQKEGYESVTETMAADIDGWYFGNIGFGGLIGLLIVDPASGAMWKLRDHVSANMYENRNYSKTNATSDTSIKSITPYSAPILKDLNAISEQLKKLKELKDLGVLTNDEYENKRKLLADKL